jgi:glycine cleavage system H protein
VYPDDLQYTTDHEWVRAPGETDGSVRIGITDYAQDALGDIVFVDISEIGTDVESGATLGELESTKSVSDLFAPVAGTVVAVNPTLEQSPELVNSDPYGEGWLVEIVPADPSQLDHLLDVDAYTAQLDVDT